MLATISMPTTIRLHHQIPANNLPASGLSSIQTIKILPWLLTLLILWTPPSMAGFLDLSPQPLPYAAPDAPFISQGKTHSLAEYKGQKVMLWLFSTWCHTCIAGVKALQEKQAIWNKTGLVVLAIRNYNNGGYAGPSISTFMKKIAPQLLHHQSWVNGEATKIMQQEMNQKRFPDIYYLIDKAGFVQVVSTAPTATMNKILKFAQGTPR